MFLSDSGQDDRRGRVTGWLLFLLSLATACGHSSEAMQARSPAGAPRDASVTQAPTADSSGADTEHEKAAAPVAALAPEPSPQPARVENQLALPGTGAPRAASSAPEARLASGDGKDRDGKAPLLIYTAVLTMAVFGVEHALDSVESLARDADGYLVQRSDSAVTVRIPATRFRAALDDVGKLGDELHRQVNARDVTDEYADLELRLRNAEVMRQRLESLLVKTGNISDALAVERELERLAQTIEQLKGRLKVVGEQVAFSTITVHFQAKSADHADAKVELPFEWLRELGLARLLQL